MRRYCLRCGSEVHYDGVFGYWYDSLSHCRCPLDGDPLHVVRP